MISVCTVIKGYSNEYLDTFNKSLYRHCKHIKEVIVYDVDKTNNRIPYGTENLYHAIGLFDCIQKASQEYILLSDPDILVLSSIDELYLELMHKHNLYCVGVAHHSPHMQPYLNMPVVFNMLMKKNQLPPQNFMENEYTNFGHPRKKLINGNWLLPGKTENKNYPNPNATIWDTGNKLCLHIQNKRWLS